MGVFQQEDGGKMIKRRKVNGRTAKDFVNLWRRLYYEKVGLTYNVSWVLDTSVFRRLMATYSNLELLELVEFAFSDHEVAKYLRDRGYPIRLFNSCINTFMSTLHDPVASIPKCDLELDTPYWDDSRTGYIWYKICDGDINAIVENVDDPYYWKLLLAKLSIQNGGVSAKTKRFYKMWQCKETVERRAMNGNTTEVNREVF